MILLLVVLFFVFYLITPGIVYPVNLLLSLFTAFQIQAGIFLRGAIGILLSIISIALLLEVVFDKIGWYRFEFDEDRELTIFYRASIFQSYQHVDFNLRYTKIQYVDRLIWITSHSEDRAISLLLLPPPEMDEENFYLKFDSQMDFYYYKVKKQYENLTFSDFDFFLFNKGRILKLTPRDFELVSGIRHFYVDDEKNEKEDVEYLDQEKEQRIRMRADKYEFEQILSNAQKVKLIE